MKPVGNIAKYLDLSKPVTGAEVKKAMARAKAEQKPLTIKAAAKAGYGLELIQPTHQAEVCASLFHRAIRPIPHFVRA